MKRVVKHFANYFIEIFKRWDSKETVCHTDTSASLMCMQLLAIIDQVYLRSKTIDQTFHRRTLEATEEKHIAVGTVENVVTCWQTQNY